VHVPARRGMHLKKIQLIHFEWKKDVPAQGAVQKSRSYSIKCFLIQQINCVGTKKQELCLRGKLCGRHIRIKCFLIRLWIFVFFSDDV
jgi:hypothetical protein